MSRVAISIRQSRGITLAVAKADPAARVHISAFSEGGTEPGDVITVNGFTAAAIDAANAAAGAGDTVYFPSGVYTHANGLVFKDYVTYLGAGIYDQGTAGGAGGTWLQCSIRWGSHVTVAGMLIGTNLYNVTCTHIPIQRGSSAAGSHTQANGSHDSLFSYVRFKGGSDTGAHLIDTSSNFSSDWGSARRTYDLYSTEWRDCEFERPQISNATLGTSTAAASCLNLWYDCRSGGSQLHDLTFTRCHLGVMNSREGRTGAERYGMGGAGCLIQPAPAEHSYNGPRPPYYLSGTTTRNPNYVSYPGDTGYVNCWYPGFDWALVDHGAYNITFVDCIMEYATWSAFNPCDLARSYSIWKGNETGLDGTLTVGLTAAENLATGWGNGPQEEWVNIPTDMWLDYLTLTRCYFKGRLTGASGPRKELCRNATFANSFLTSVTGDYNNVVTGSFSNTTRPTTYIFTVDWTGSGTSYTASPYDPA